jgi:hypothetical protein
MVIEKPWISMIRISLSLLVKNADLLMQVSSVEELVRKLKCLLDVYQGDFARAIEDSLVLGIEHRDLCALEQE